MRDEAASSVEASLRKVTEDLQRELREAKAANEAARECFRLS